MYKKNKNTTLYGGRKVQNSFESAKKVCQAQKNISNAKKVFRAQN